MSGTSALVHRLSDPYIMPFFFQKSHPTGSTELGITHTHPHSMTAIQPAHCPTMIKPYSSWFCSPVVCGSSTTTATLNVTDSSQQSVKTTPLSTIPGRPVFYNRDQCHIPAPILALFVYLAQQGVRVSDMFRRPGNVAQMRLILERFNAGEPIQWEEYNVYTVANVAKKLLLSIPDGLFGPAGEAELLATATHPSCASELLDLKSPCATPVEEQSPIEGTGRKSSSGRTAAAEHKSVSFRIRPDDGEEELRLWTRSSATSLLPWPLAAIRQLHQLYEVGERRVTVCLRVLDTLPPSHQQMVILMLGILHQLIFRSTSIEDTWSSLVSRANACVISSSESTSSGSQPTDDSTPNIPLLTLAEGVVKSVAGTLFHTCATSVSRVEQAAQVLRSLVVYFPTMGDSITRFYSDAIAGRLSYGVPDLTTLGTEDPPSSLEPGTERNGSRSVCCILCPKSDHSLYFDQLPVASRERSPCPSNLLQAASRLFCLGGTPTTPVHSRPGTVGTGGGNTTTSKRHTRKANMKKPWADLTKSNELRVKQKPPDSPIRVSGPCLQGDSERYDTTFSPPTCATSTVSQIDLPTHALAETQHTTTERPMLLRRNQSRYRSLRRRQMENLSRRAEWFLGPTVVPVVHLKPSCWRSQQPDNYNESDLVVQSAISLLELGGDTASTRADPKITGPSLLATPPRLLFTASTGELVQPDTSDVRSDSDRKRLLSVGSSLTALSSDSFVSIHSAPPPPDWIQADCSRVTSKQNPLVPSGLSNRARSISPRPCQVNPDSFNQPKERSRRSSDQSSMQTSFVETDVVVIINEPSDQEQ